MNEGTIYPLLKRLLNDHLLESYLKESTEGPPRKYYHITAAGISKYQELLKEWNEFSKRVSDFWRKRTMNKQEFLNQLEKKLDRINETERKIFLWNTEHISMTKWQQVSRKKMRFLVWRCR